MRIVGGTASGRRLVTPPGSATRPTAERVREALFNSLATEIVGSRVLDLYGGSGALGLEAASWGAKSVVVVESSCAARQAIAENIAALAMADQVELWSTSAEKAIALLTEGHRAFDIVLCDPPWSLGMSSEVCDRLHCIMPAGGLIVVEHAANDTPRQIVAAQAVRVRSYGRTTLTMFRVQAKGGAET